MLTDLYFNYISLTGEMGRLGRVLEETWRAQETYYTQVSNRREAQDRALQERLPDLRQELAEMFAGLLKLANHAGVNLEEAYLEKMHHNQEHTPLKNKSRA